MKYISAIEKGIGNNTRSSQIRQFLKIQNFLIDQCAQHGLTIRKPYDSISHILIYEGLAHYEVSRTLRTQWDWEKKILKINSK